MPTATQAPPSLSLHLLARAVERSRRRAVQLPIGFFRTSTTDPPPIARMLRGGRSGAVRLKLYLCITLIAAKAPHDVRSVPARTWAQMLDLAEPETLGSRRITDALKWLEAEKFVDVTGERGIPPTVTLKNALGDGTPYVRPTGRYVSVPVGLWTSGWITRLSGSGLALLLVLLDLQGGIEMQSDAPWLPGDMKPRYGLSADTWTRATKELIGDKLLTVNRVPQGKEFDWSRLRNTYWIHEDRLS